LLAVEHLRAIDADLDDLTINKLSGNSLFRAEEVRLIYEKAAEIQIFKRATLPHRCHNCGSTDFHYAALRCICGVPIYEAADSMTAIVRIGG